jgi:hypothetical protein
VARDEVEHAADGADHDRRAALEVRLLVANRRAAEDGDRVGPLARAVGAQGLGDLDAELARGCQHQRLDVLVLRIDALDHRQPEGRGLPRAGLRLADHVAALEEDGDGLLLDRAGRLVAHVPQGLEDFLGQAEIGERAH